jgi:predicted ABC-type ATPase
VADAPCLYVLAGTNGAGKSSIAGARFRESGGDYFNPDEAARGIRLANPAIGQEDANAAAWHHGTRLLERAIAERLTYAFETTLGGDTITARLEAALSAGIDVRIWYVGLDTPERHVARVRSRVATGGHDIPEQRIRERYDRSRLNLIRLLPRLTELRLYDNSHESDPGKGLPPRPVLVLHMRTGRIVATCDLAAAPAWTKPILMAAIKDPPGGRR